MNLTPAQLREHAAEIILDHARDVETLSISEHFEDLELPEPDHDEACNTVDELIRTADVTVTWPVGTPIGSVISEVIAERQAQDAKWGEQNHPDGTGNLSDRRDADSAREWCKSAFAAGYGTWRLVLDEEVAEAYAEGDPATLRAELVQVAAVACAWIEAIDRRTTPAADG